MKALTMTEPRAALVVDGEKQFETRGWKPIEKDGFRFPVTIAIHTARSFPPEAQKEVIRQPFKAALARHGLRRAEDFTLGAIIGVVTIVEVMRSEEIAPFIKGTPELKFGNYAPNRWAWRLINARRLKEPIPCKGALTLWEVPADVEALIRAQIEI